MPCASAIILNYTIFGEAIQAGTNFDAVKTTDISAFGQQSKWAIRLPDHVLCVYAVRGPRKKNRNNVYFFSEFLLCC